MSDKGYAALSYPSAAPIAAPGNSRDQGLDYSGGWWRDGDRLVVVYADRAALAWCVAVTAAVNRDGAALAAALEEIRGAR